MELLSTLQEFYPTLIEALVETLYMTFFAVSIAYIIGIPIGITLYLTSPAGIYKNKYIHPLLGGIVNMFRSVPFLILMIIAMPLTRMIVGTAIGSVAAIVPLVIAAAPFVSRMVETSVNELDKGVIDAARAMGASTWQIIYKVIIPESIPSLIRGLAITTIMMISFSAMAGAIGAGGLGRVAIRYGYQRFRNDIMWLTIIVIILLVAIIQFVCNQLAKKIDKR